MNTKVATQAPATQVPPAAQEMATITRDTGLIARIAARFAIDQTKMLETLKQTAFRQRPPKGGGEVKIVTNEQMMALLVVADQYHLNPFTREIYAFPQDGGIVPIIPIDGWLRIINEHPQFESIEIALPEDPCEPDDYWTECLIVRKDRKKPIKIREWLKECYRSTEAWDSHPKRMLRHKAIIQCARIAFGFAGVFDPDEGDRIINVTADSGPARVETKAPRSRKTVAAQAAAEPATPTSEPQAPASTNSVMCISLDQSTVLADKVREEGVRLDAVLEKFGIGAIEDLPASQYQAAFLFIDQLSGGEV
jgi:phage recombination protein Bet